MAAVASWPTGSAALLKAWGMRAISASHFSVQSRAGVHVLSSKSIIEGLTSHNRVKKTKRPDSHRGGVGTHKAQIQPMLFQSSIRKELARSFGATLVVLITIVLTI